MFSAYGTIKLKGLEIIYSSEKDHMLSIHCYFEFLNKISSQKCIQGFETRKNAFSVKKKSLLDIIVI